MSYEAGFACGYETADEVRRGVEKQRDAALTELAALRSELNACSKWRAERMVALSQDPTCLRWMHASQEAEDELAALHDRIEAVLVCWTFPRAHAAALRAALAAPAEEK